MELSAVGQKSWLHVDPRTKIILLLSIGVLTFMNVPSWFTAAAFILVALLMVGEGQGRTAVAFSLVFFMMLALDTLFASRISGPLGPLFLTLVRMPRLVMPILMASSLLIKTTTVSEFIAAFRKWRVPETIVIPFSVMFRFIPTIKEEWQSINNAMRFRGIGFTAKNVVTKPMTTLEYVLVPLLMSSATISDELAAASLSRGLDVGGERTSLTEVRLGLLDVVLILLCIGMFGYLVVGR